MNSKHYFIDASVISPVNVKMRTDKNPKQRAIIQLTYSITQTLALAGQKCLTKKLKCQIQGSDIIGHNISLIDIKPHFMTQDFHLKIYALSETEIVGRYDNVSLFLSNENLKKGNCSLDFNEATAVFTIDAVFMLKSK